MDEIKKIVVVDVAGIGDTVMSVPALRALRRKYPDGVITLVAAPRTAPLLQACPYINKVLTFDIEHFKHPLQLCNLTKTLKAFRMLWELRLENYDIAINLYRIASRWGRLRMKAFFVLIKPALSVGRRPHKAKSIFSLEYVDYPHDATHEVERMLEVVKLIGFQASDQRLELWVSQEEKIFIEGFFKGKDLSGNDLIIGINPNAYQDVNLWFEERFARLADYLIETYAAKVILFASKRDTGRVGRILDLMQAQDNAVILAGELTLNQYVAALERVKLFITLDSGPMHIASVFKIPTVALFGAEDTNRFRPYQNRQALLIQKRVQCPRCRKKLPCKKRCAMRIITVEDVCRNCDLLLRSIKSG